MNPRIARASWPIARLGEAAIALSKFLGMPPSNPWTGAPPPGADPRALTQWLQSLESSLQLEFQAIEPSLAGLAGLLTRDLPKLALLKGEEGDRVLLLLERTWQSVVLLCPDGRRTTIPGSEVEDAIAEAALEEAGHHIEPFLDLAAIPASKRAAARRAILGDWLDEREIGTLWRVRISPSASMRRQASRARLPRLVLLFTLAFGASQLLVVISWWLLWKGAFSGHLEAGYRHGWALVLLSTLPFLHASNWLQGQFSIAVGRLLKARLLRGATSIDPDRLKHEGLGHQIGRVVEADTFELLSLNGGFTGILGLFQLAAATAVLAMGPGRVYHIAAVLAWLLWTAASGHRYRKARLRWSNASLRLTHDAVERMAGNRTRLIQQSASFWHDEEDRDLATVAQAAAEMDRRDVLLRAVVPRGWLILGLTAFLPALLDDRLPMASLALGFGGILMAYEGFYMLSQSLAHLIHAQVSWALVRDLFNAGAAEPARPRRAPPPSPGDDAVEPEGASPLVEASHVAFRYSDRMVPALAACDLVVTRRDRILLQGPSGGGKSTLASLLSGLRDAQEGTLLLDGLDGHTLGKEEWRRRVVLVPQFHDNHVFTASFAFNLLVGRRWPAHDEDYRAAEEVCRALGLGKLLERMPSGLAEMVGEGGWRLSHGERSRLFVARAILQSPRLLILDESLGALDPHSVLRCLDYITQAPCALVLISHS